MTRTLGRASGGCLFFVSVHTSERIAIVCKSGVINNIHPSIRRGAVLVEKRESVVQYLAVFKSGDSIERRRVC